MMMMKFYLLKNYGLMIGPMRASDVGQRRYRFEYWESGINNRYSVYRYDTVLLTKKPSYLHPEASTRTQSTLAYALIFTCSSSLSLP